VVDVEAKKAKKSPFRLGQHGTILRGKKGSKDATAEARSNKGAN
jgi:hypothetical protein